MAEALAQQQSAALSALDRALAADVPIDAPGVYLEQLHAARQAIGYARTAQWGLSNAVREARPWLPRRRAQAERLCAAIDRVLLAAAQEEETAKLAQVAAQTDAIKAQRHEREPVLASFRSVISAT